MDEAAAIRWRVQTLGVLPNVTDSDLRELGVTMGARKMVRVPAAGGGFPSAWHSLLFLPPHSLAVLVPPPWPATLSPCFYALHAQARSACPSKCFAEDRNDVLMLATRRNISSRRF